VSDTELRFDFSHFEKMTDEEIARVEEIASAIVLQDLRVETEAMSLDRAKASGAMAHFEEEYKGKDAVRVVSVGDFSRELCGGTHVAQSGEIGLIKIVSEESIAAGTRRIRAVTGEAALARLRAQEALVGELRETLGEEPLEGVRRLREEVAVLRDRLGSMTQNILREKCDEFLGHKEEYGGVSLVTGRLDMGVEAMKALADLLEDRARPAVILLVGDIEGQGRVTCKVSKRVDTIDAGALTREVATVLGGRGGGNRSFAQGSGPDVSKLKVALERGRSLVRAALAAD
jgi:alanyl-tRNA synthetase